MAGVSTLVVSDLHLGSAWKRDVLRRPAALERLLEAVREHDRLVILGDVVELLEGRPEEAMDVARPVLREIGRAARDKRVVVVPGNHDFAIVRPWLQYGATTGRKLSLEARVGRESSPALSEVTKALRPARVVVRYPGLWLADGVWAHHGHYLDRHMTPDLVRRAVLPRFARVVGEVPEDATPRDYERAGGANFAAISGLLATEAGGDLGDVIDRAAGAARRAALSALPSVGALRGVAGLAAGGSDTIAAVVRRASLASMGEVVRRLGVEAEHVVFGHIHRAGPLPGDDLEEWRARTGARLVNTGCWVYEPVLLDAAGPRSPYWPGRAVVVGDDGVPQPVALLGDLTADELR